MEWIKKHTDTAVILTAICGGLIWMNGKFNSIDKQFGEIHTELAIVKTVMIMKGIMPTELASKDKGG